MLTATLEHYLLQIVRFSIYVESCGINGVVSWWPRVTEPFSSLLNEKVVLDTGTPIVYIGTLIAVTDATFELLEADMHDCRDGHASQDEYLVDARDEGITVNRRRVIVMRSAVISVSRVADIVNE